MWIEVLSAGEAKDSLGREHVFTPADLDLIAMRYNSAMAESPANSAPLVKGHPLSDSPAHGWVERLARRGNKLLARLTSLSPEIIEDIRQNRFRKVSVSLYPDRKLKHVGLLGGASPAFKNLAPVSFCHTDFEPYPDESPEAESADPEGTPDTRTIKEQNRELGQRIAMLEKEARLKEYREFAESLSDAADSPLITPAQAGQLVDILESARRNPEADSMLSSPRPLDERIMEFMSGIRPGLSAAELKASLAVRTRAASFSDGSVDAGRLALHNRALEIKENTPGISYEEAVCMAYKQYN